MKLLTLSDFVCFCRQIMPLYYAFVIYLIVSLHPAPLSMDHHCSTRWWTAYYNPSSQHVHKIILISLVPLCTRSLKILTQSSSQKCQNQNFSLEVNLWHGVRINCIICLNKLQKKKKKDILHGKCFKCFKLLLYRLKFHGICSTNRKSRYISFE